MCDVYVCVCICVKWMNIVWVMEKDALTIVIIRRKNKIYIYRKENAKETQMRSTHCRKRREKGKE